MATTKRKAVTDDRPSKKIKSTKEPGKAIKSAPAQDDETKEARPAPKSILQPEERAFPRGGASVLTPLEQRQIRAQAERDVLFEHKTGQAVANEDGDLFEADETAAATTKGKKQKKRRLSGDAPGKVEKSGIKISGLSYKNLVVGSVVLGYVTAITGKDVALALANNLTGYVPITAVSDVLNSRIETLLGDDGPDADAENSDEDVDLKKLFHVGQWLRATVTSTGQEATDTNSKNKRHIELSADPRQVNGALEVENVVVNGMMQAAVRSVEDHGIVMDLGLSDPSVKGFVSKKELGSAFKMEDIQEGQIMMCIVTGKASGGKVVKLSPDASRFAVSASGKLGPSVTDAPTLDGIQTGTAVDVLITESGAGGVAGKVMGMLDVTADIVHAGSRTSDDDLEKKYKVGSKIRARVIWTLPAEDDKRRVGISLQAHLLTLPPPSTRLPEAASSKLRAQSTALEQHLPLSSTVNDLKVTNVLPSRGLFMSLPSLTGDPKKAATAFAHISQLTDGHVDTITASSGSYRIDSTHRARIIAYNPIDDVHYVSLKQSVLDQQFLRLEDIKVGEVVKGNVERLILGGAGITGALVKLSEGITGLVPTIHLSDTQLQHPERKYKEGLPVKARVLSVDMDKRQMRLTLKKTLVNNDEVGAIWQKYAGLKEGMEGKGTIVRLLPNGAAVQFFGDVRAWLPVAEMSEAFVEAPEKHFRLGQTVDVRILSVNADTQEMKVSCKSPDVFNDAQQTSWEELESGQAVSASVTEKSADSVSVELSGGLKGVVRMGHLTDTPERVEKALKKAHVGQQLADLVVVQKMQRSKVVLLSKKPTLIKAANSSTLITSFSDAAAAEGKQRDGFVRNITPEGVYIEFANNVVGLLPKSQMTTELIGQAAFGLKKDQSIKTWVSHVDPARERFTLSTRKPESASTATTSKQAEPAATAIVNAADPSISAVSDLHVGRVTKARIASVKATQLNVRLGDQVQGRVDVSEAFDAWEDIKNKKAPLVGKFQAGEIIDVKILGVHDARSHKFLPISHRGASVPVFELSAKPSRVQANSESGLTMESVTDGSKHLAFVNNHSNQGLWANISPNVRGRIAQMDLSDDASQIMNPEKHFPIGCAVQVTVKRIDAAANKLDLTVRTATLSDALTLHNVTPGMIVAGRVTKITERSLTVQLSDTLAAPVPFLEMTDDYDQLNINQHQKNDIVRVCILDVDLPNKKLYISLRPSRVLSSSLPVKDPQITTHAQLHKGDVVRGFVKHVAEKGIVVALGSRVDAFVQVRDLSDEYVKEWKNLFQLDQLVKGRVTKVEVDGKHAQMSLKASHLKDDYKPSLAIADLQPGDIVTGQVRKVEEFGAFIDIDNTQPRLSGLCHRSEIAEKRIQDVRKVYSEGDKVKAKVLAVDPEARKISLGLKASYFADTDGLDEDEDMDDDDDDEGVDLDELSEGGEDDSGSDGGIDLSNVQDLESEDEDEDEDQEDADDMEIDEAVPSTGLKTGGFDWSGDAFEPAANGGASDSEPEATAPKKTKRRKPEIKEDLTGDLDKYGPRSADDFERQLLGQPNDSSLWIQYMAFQLQLSELQKARDISDRALRTIHIREMDEKANVWIARLNLEVEYGNEDEVEDVFKRACQVQDPLQMHEKMASVYIDAGKHDKADEVFEKIVANKAYRASPDVWLNYGSFLLDTLKAPARARAQLPRALQSIPTSEHRPLTAKFAALEFRSKNGDTERGRTIFEGLISEWPKWSSGWDMFVDLERAKYAQAEGKEAKAEARSKVRALYERIVAGKMKKRRAKFVFKRWLEFEEKEGSGKSVERVKALAKEYVEKQAQGDDEMEE